MYAGGTDLWISTDGGMTFDRTTEPHVDHHGFATDPIDRKIIYTVSDGGIYRSSDRGKDDTWAFIGEGITNTEFYDIANSATEPDLVIGGTQDNGTIKYNGSSTVWEQIRGGDGATVDIDPTDADIMYFMGQHADSIRRSTDGGNSNIWPLIADGLPTGSVCKNLHWHIHPSDPSTLLASCMSLWRASPPGATWTSIFTSSSGNVVRSAVDPKSNLYFAGTDDGQIYAGVAGSGWQEIYSHPSGRAVTDITVSPDNSKVVFASFDGVVVNRIVRLVRSSLTPITFDVTNIAGGLPANLKVKCVAVDLLRPRIIFAGTQSGVYRGVSDSSGLAWSWVAYNNGLPLADVHELEVHPSTGVLRAGTFGRGAYEVNTDSPVGSVLSATGHLTLLRVHDVGTKYGPPMDQIDVEAVIWLDSRPGQAFGFQLRDDANESAHRRMLDILRDAFNHGRRVRIDYVRTGSKSGRILRVRES